MSKTTEDLRAEFADLRTNSPEILDLGSQAVTDAQASKTEGRIRTIQGLRAWSQGEGTRPEHRIG